jgi:hypothetical protein
MASVAYGLFTGAYGVFWFIGSALIGLMYSRPIFAMTAFCILAELGAIPFFMLVRKTAGFERTT